jgi:hypothetical protein
MKVARWTLLVAVVLASVISTAPASAKPDAHKGKGNARIVPAHVIRGLTASELIGTGFLRAYTSTPETPPTDCPTFGRRGEILLMESTGQTVTCTVKPGTPVFVFGFGSACSDVEPDPFFAKGASAQEDCARAFNAEFIDRIQVTVDDREPVDLLTDRFEVTSPQRFFMLPENNFFGKPAGTEGSLVAVAYVGVIRGLTPGRHTILSDVATTEFADTTTLILNVVPGS